MRAEERTFTRDGIISSSGDPGTVGPDGTIVQFERDTTGRITKITEPRMNFFNQNLWFYGYDAIGNLTTVTQPGGDPPIQYQYDADHNLTKTIDARGNAARTSTYDTDGRLLTDTDATGKVITYVLTAEVTS